MNIVRFVQRGIGEFKLTTHLNHSKQTNKNTKDNGVSKFEDLMHFFKHFVLWTCLFSSCFFLFLPCCSIVSSVQNVFKTFTWQSHSHENHEDHYKKTTNKKCLDMCLVIDLCLVISIFTSHGSRM